MPRDFFHTTAELTIQVVEAVVASGGEDAPFVERFCDISAAQAANALGLAVDLGLIKESGGRYKSASPLVRFISLPDDRRKAALLRIALEVYEPFTSFAERLRATGSVDLAAQQTKTMLDLTSHREDVKDTLLSLGTYTNAMRAEGGGRYVVTDEAVSSQLLDLARGCGDLAAAEARIRIQLGQYADSVDRDEVVRPLASALMKAAAGSAVDAVVEAAKAVESFLVRLAHRLGVNVAGATGITQKTDRFRTGNHLPKKIVESSRYLAQIRNAADHGVDVDPDVGSVWHIQESTALEYVFVACSFIVSCRKREENAGFWL